MTVGQAGDTLTDLFSIQTFAQRPQLPIHLLLLLVLGGSLFVQLQAGGAALRPSTDLRYGDKTVVGFGLKTVQTPQQAARLLFAAGRTGSCKAGRHCGQCLSTAATCQPPQCAAAAAGCAGPAALPHARRLSTPLDTWNRSWRKAFTGVAAHPVAHCGQAKRLTCCCALASCACNPSTWAFSSFCSTVGWCQHRGQMTHAQHGQQRQGRGAACFLSPSCSAAVWFPQLLLSSSAA